MEKSDFSKHRILVLGGKTHTMSVLRSILGICGVTQIVHVEESRRAVDLLLTEHFTAVFCDTQAEEVDGMIFPVAARRREGILNPMIPIFAIQERARRRDVEQARDTGVTDVLTTPVSPKTIMLKLKSSELAPRPFIVSSEFFGPDRRGKNRVPWTGEERRKKMAKKARIDFTHI
jgi:CheY-like chemotaxis protein